MRSAIYVPNFGQFQDIRLLADLAYETEQSGWDGFFIWDHIARLTSHGPVVDPWIALTAIALKTNRLRLGALVTPLARRRPWKVARETASLDQLSNGRLIFSTGLGGAGGSQVEWDNFGEVNDLKVRAAMTDEGLAVLAGLWSGRPFSYQGHYYSVKESLFLPAPVQTPRIPIWVGGRWPNLAPLRRAARWDGYFPLFDSDDEVALAQFTEAVNAARQHRPDLTHFDFVYCGRTLNLDPVERAAKVNALAAAGCTWWLENLAPLDLTNGWDTPAFLAEVHQRIRQGPPA